MEDLSEWVVTWCRQHPGSPPHFHISKQQVKRALLQLPDEDIEALKRRFLDDSGDDAAQSPRNPQP